MSLKGAGAIRFWGFSPAVDLLAHGGEAAEDGEDAQPLRALLLCPSDVRHLMQTLTAAVLGPESKSGSRAVEFTVYEEAPEALARHLLLLAIALDMEVPRRERAELFLEVYANAMLREKTSSYVASRAQALRRLLAQEEGPLAPLIDVSLLKMRVRGAPREGRPTLVTARVATQSGSREWA